VTPGRGLGSAGTREGNVAGVGRVSSLLQRASGREVVITAEAQARSARFMSTDAGSVAVVAPSSSAFTAEQSPRQPVKPFPAAVAAVTPGPTITAPVPVTPGSILGSALAGGMSGAGRVSSLLQRASGKEVVISAEARARSARFMGADSGFGPVAAQGGSADTTVQTPQQPPNPFPSTMSVPTVAAPSLVTRAGPATPGSSLSGADGVAGGGRVSSLLQRASGKEVVISAEAQARSARFMSADPSTGAQSNSAYTTLQTPHLADDPSSASMAAPTAAAPTATRAVSVTPGSGLSGAGVVAAGGRVSSLLQRASGKEVVISAEAQARSARFMSTDLGAAIVQGTDVHTEGPTSPSTVNPFGTSAAAPSVAVAVPVTPGSGLSGAGGVDWSGPVSSLLQSASCGEGVISEAQARSARFMSTASGAPVVEASAVPDQSLRHAVSIHAGNTAHQGPVRAVTPAPGARDPLLSATSVGTYP
jgi:hypothetical protein